MIVFIKENSRLARLAAWKLGSPNAAIVIGRTIHLWGASREEFLLTTRWVRHEVGHVYQYQKLGLLRFLFLYLTESMRRGYLANRFEREARSCEGDEKILDGIVFR